MRQPPNHPVVLIMGMLVLAGATVGADTRIVITSLLPGPPGPTQQTLIDYVINVDRGVIESIAPAGYNGLFSRSNVISVTADGRFAVQSVDQFAIGPAGILARDLTTSSSVLRTLPPFTLPGPPAAHPHRLAVYASLSGSVQDFAIVDQTGVRTFDVCPSSLIASRLAISRRGDAVFVPCGSSVAVVDAINGSVLRQMPVPATIGVIHTLADVNRLALVIHTLSGRTSLPVDLALIDANTGAELTRRQSPFAELPLFVWSVANPAGDLIYAGLGAFTSDSPQTIRTVVFRADTLEYVREVAITNAFAVAISPDDRRAAFLSKRLDGLLAERIRVSWFDLQNNVELGAGDLGYRSFGIEGTGLAVAVASPPLAPLLVATRSGSQVTVSWSLLEHSPSATGFQLDVGSATGLSNLMSSSLGATETTLTVPSVPRGTYFMRLRAINAQGVGAVSNEVTITVP